MTLGYDHRWEKLRLPTLRLTLYARAHFFTFVLLSCFVHKFKCPSILRSLFLTTPNLIKIDWVHDIISSPYLTFRLSFSPTESQAIFCARRVGRKYNDCEGDDWTTRRRRRQGSAGKPISFYLVERICIALGWVGGRQRLVYHIWAIWWQDILCVSFRARNQCCIAPQSLEMRILHACCCREERT